MRLLGTAGVMAIGTITPAIAIGWIGSKSVEAIGRNRRKRCASIQIRGDGYLRRRPGLDYPRKRGWRGGIVMPLPSIII